MVGRLAVLVSVFAISNAVPIWIDGKYLPGILFRSGRSYGSPNIAFGFGSGFSSNIGGISHSTGISSSFQSGDAQAYGAGLAGSSGNVFARGVGYANAAPSLSLHPQVVAATFNGLGRSYGSAISSAQNFGNYGSAVSSAQSHGGYGTAASVVLNNGFGRHQSAISAAQNIDGLGYNTAVSSAGNGLGYGSAVSSAQNVGNFRSAVSAVHGLNGNGNYGTAISAAQNIGGFRASTAQTTQGRGLGYQNSGASSINGPGIQAAQSHAVNNF